MALDLERALALHGDEIAAFLRRTHASHDDAREAYAMFLELLLRAQGKVEPRASTRAFLFIVARTATRRLLRRRARDRRLLTPEAHHPSVDPRTRTTSTLGDRRRALVDLRDELSLEDRELLVLHVERELSFREIAELARAPRTSLDREEARLRKRFQIVRERLVDRGRARGLLRGAAPT